MASNNLIIALAKVLIAAAWADGDPLERGGQRHERSALSVAAAC